MRHTVINKSIDGYEVTVYSEQRPVFLIVQPLDSHDIEEMPAEIEYIEEHTGKPFALAAVKIEKWNDELTPWPAPPVFGKTPFGNGASRTLCFIENNLLPILRQAFDCARCNILGGYSLAGFFALWATCQTDTFAGTVAASPSVWYNNWLDYSKNNACKSRFVYLSLGDRESHSKNTLMATVADAIQEQKEILKSHGTPVIFEWNAGNHFTDNGIRTGKGFCTTIEFLSQHF